MARVLEIPYTATTKARPGNRRVRHEPVVSQYSATILSYRQENVVSKKVKNAYQIMNWNINGFQKELISAVQLHIDLYVLYNAFILFNKCLMCFHLKIVPVTRFLLGSFEAAAPLLLNSACTRAENVMSMTAYTFCKAKMGLTVF